MFLNIIMKEYANMLHGNAKIVIFAFYGAALACSAFCINLRYITQQYGNYQKKRVARMVHGGPSEVSTEAMQENKKKDFREKQSKTDKESRAGLEEQNSICYLEDTLSDTVIAQQYYCKSLTAPSQTSNTTSESASDLRENQFNQSYKTKTGCLDDMYLTFSKENYEMLIETKAAALQLPSIVVEVSATDPNAVTVSGTKSSILQVEKAIDNLKQIQRDELTNLTDQEMDKAANGCKEISKLNSNVHFRQLPAERKVKIFGKSYADVSRAKLSLLIAVGREKETGRGKRMFYNRTYDENESEIVVQSSSATSLIPKGPKLFETDEGISVHIYTGDLLCLKVDCIVNAANSELDHAGGVASSIASAAGNDLVEDCKKYISKHGSLPVGGNCITRSGNLKHYKCVIHTVGPDWDSYTESFEEEKLMVKYDLKNAVIGCLFRASIAKCASIALPAISSGIYGVPLDICVSAYVDSVKEFSRADGKTTSLREIHFVDSKEETVQVMASGFTNPRPSSQQKFPQHSKFYNQQSTNITSHMSHLQTGQKNPNNVRPYPYWGTTLTGQYTQPIYQLFVNEKLKVLVYTGDISKEKYAHAIVSSENETFDGQGRIASLLLEKGGAKYKKEHEKLKTSKTKYKVTDVVDTKAGNLPFNFVIHAVMPIWKEDMINNLEVEKGYIHAYAVGVENILKYVDKLPVTSVAFPLIGAGGKHLGSQKISNMLTHSILEYSNNQTETSQLQVIYIINNLDGSTSAVINSFQSYIDKCQSSDGSNRQKFNKSFSMTVVKPMAIDMQSHDDQLMEIDNDGTLVSLGEQPDGKMSHRTQTDVKLPGYPKYSTIVIEFFFPSGKHRTKDNKKKPYDMFHTPAYLPNTLDGKKVLQLLEVAFNRKMLFEVVNYRDIVDKITFKRGIHLKTRIHGGIERHGYPDLSYLNHVTKQLADKGITETCLKKLDT